MSAPLGRPWLAEILNEYGECIHSSWFETQAAGKEWVRLGTMHQPGATGKVTRAIAENQTSMFPTEDRVIPGQQTIAPAVKSLTGSRDGATFAEEDRKRLNKQALRVYAVMRDEQYHSLQTIAERTGDPEASISARLRDLRKAKFGGHSVMRRRIPETGVWMYRLVWNDDYPRPPLSEVEDAYV
jgi:hypothetical protein